MAEWIMVLITFVYVIATIFICVYNYRSARAAREQVEEMRRQYKNDLLIKMMPCLLIKSISKTKKISGSINLCFHVENKAANNNKLRKSIYFKVYNIGHDIAKEVDYYFEPDINFDKGYRIISLPVNDFRIVKINVSYFPDSSNQETYTKNVYINIRYSDLFNNKYVQTLTVRLNLTHSEINMETYYLSAPRLIDD